MPRLLRAYGGDPMMWLARTPSVVVRACVEMLPRLEAEDTIARSNAHALGAGTIAQDDGRRLRQDLAAACAGSTGRRRRANPGVLAQHGFAVRRIPTKRSEPG